MPIHVLVEVPLGSFLKPRPDRRVDYVSPVPCPFNYGSVPGRTGGDGDPQDAILLGRRRHRGELVETELHAVVRFLDAGRTDDKWVCADRPPTAAERVLVTAFFVLYARLKRVLNRLRGARGETRFLGWSSA